MTAGKEVNSEVRNRVFQWAVGRRESATVTLKRDGDWIAARSSFLWFDEAGNTLALLYPTIPTAPTPPEIAVGEQVGVSFRRGHKKCVFTTTVVARRNSDDGAPMLMVSAPTVMHEYQRRAYQRAVVPPDQSIAVRILAASDRAPIGTGRLCDLSAGGTMIEVEPPLHARMRVSEAVRLELAVDPSTPPLCVEGVCRHVSARPSGRIGFGVQFRGLEATSQGQAALEMIATLVRAIRKPQRESSTPRNSNFPRRPA